MMRPASILNFERFYFLYLISSVVTGVIYFDRQVERTAAVREFREIAPLVVGGSIAFGLLIVLLLWYFAARRVSAIARWLVLAQFAFAAGKMALNLASGKLTLGGNGLLPVIMLVVLGAATWFLFRPDARAWRGTPAAGEPA